MKVWKQGDGEVCRSGFTEMWGIKIENEVSAVGDLDVRITSEIQLV